MGNTGPVGTGGPQQKIEDRYFLQKVKLGQGSFGTVWRAVDKHNDRVVAIKQLDKAGMPKRQVTRKDIEREVELMKAVKHENITQLFDTFEDDQSIFIALEYCDGGDFGDKVKERGMSLREEEAADWMAQICAAIAALHTKGICHRDIKPDNFMVAVTTLKLSDFGLACFLTRGKALTEKCGTPAFMAPEQVNLPTKSKGYSFPCDMWAAGISMYMLMFAGRHPFLTSNKQLNNNMLLQGRLDFREAAQAAAGPVGFFDGLLGGGAAQKFNLRFSDKAREVCTRMVQPDPTRRMTAEEALKDPWLVRNRRRNSKDLTPQAGPPVQGAPQAQTVKPQGAGAGAGAGAFPAAKQQPGPKTMQNLQQMQMMQQQTDEAQRKIRSLEVKNAELQNHLVTAKAKNIVPQALARPGPLRIGLKCRYFSPSYGWLNGIVQGINDQDGTFNLDIRQHATTDKISPFADSPSSVDDIWPPGTLVAYESSQWGFVPAVVTGFNSNDNTYNLDLREHASVEKIRARIGEGNVAAAGQAAQVDDIARYAGAPNVPTDGMRTEKAHGPPADFFPDGTPQNVPAPPPPPGRGDRGDPRQTAIDPQMAGYPRQQPSDPQMPPVGTRAPPPQTMPRPPDGSKCILMEQNEGYGGGGYTVAIIEGFNPSDGTFSLLVDPNSTRRRTNAQAGLIRAPNKESDAWPAGTQVFYETSSQTQFGNWLPAVILSFNAANTTYNLDVRENAQPERVRPRSGIFSEPR